MPSCKCGYKFFADEDVHAKDCPISELRQKLEKVSRDRDVLASRSAKMQNERDEALDEIERLKKLLNGQNLLNAEQKKMLECADLQIRDLMDFIGCVHLWSVGQPTALNIRESCAAIIDKYAVKTGWIETRAEARELDRRTYTETVRDGKIPEKRVCTCGGEGTYIGHTIDCPAR